MFQDVSDVSNSNFLVFQPVLRLFFHTQNEPTFPLRESLGLHPLLRRVAPCVAPRVSSEFLRAVSPKKVNEHEIKIEVRRVAFVAFVAFVARGLGEKTDWINNSSVIAKAEKNIYHSPGKWPIDIIRINYICI